MIRKTEWMMARSVSSRERHPQNSIGMFCDANQSLALALKAHTSHGEPTGLVEVGHGTDSRSSAFSSVCTAEPMANRHVTTPTPRKNCGQIDTHAHTYIGKDAAGSSAARIRRSPGTGQNEHGCRRAGREAAPTPRTASQRHPQTQRQRPRSQPAPEHSHRAKTTPSWTAAQLEVHPRRLPYSPPPRHSQAAFRPRSRAKQTTVGQRTVIACFNSTPPLPIAARRRLFPLLFHPPRSSLMKIRDQATECIYYRFI